jgi:amidohydrolase
MGYPAMSDPRSSVRASVEAYRSRLVALSSAIHSHPETAWEEYRACQWVAELLASVGFDVTPGYLGLPTAFHAVYGSGSFRVGLMAEYDALPGLGHACGHNLIAASSAGAGIALAAVADELDLTIEIYGTPAEEGGGGKIELLDRGAFVGLDLAMMAHPSPVDIAEARPFAVSHSHIRYDGKAAHAAAYPDDGVNANDAFVIAQVALGLLRQQLPESVRVHGIMTNAGQAPNAIPDLTEGRWYVRANSLDELAVLERRVWRCFEAGALASGATLTVTPESKPYAEFHPDEFALQSYRMNAEALGRSFDTSASASRMNRASTDMGNVSHIVPSIHPYIGIGSLPATNHQREFAAHCVGPMAELALTDAAIALAWTAIDATTAQKRP